MLSQSVQLLWQVQDCNGTWDVSLFQSPRDGREHEQQI